MTNEYFCNPTSDIPAELHNYHFCNSFTLLCGAYNCLSLTLKHSQNNFIVLLSVSVQFQQTLRSYNLSRGRSRRLPSLLWISTSLGRRARSGESTFLTGSLREAQTQTPRKLHATLACQKSLQSPGLGAFLGALGRLAALARYAMQKLLIPCKSIDSHDSYI